MARDIVTPLPFGWALISGGAIGFLSGVTGLGGGVFLSPLLLFRGWATARQASAVAAAFILVNSVAGLLGHLSSVVALPNALPVWATAAIVGGWLGAAYGSQRLPSITVLRLLALVLAIAGVKLIVV